MITVIYLGCMNKPGHYYYVNGDIHTDPRPPEGCPWPQLDSKELIPANSGDPQGTGWLHHRGGWSALAIVDNSVDHRPNSRAVFAVDVPDLMENAILRLARENGFTKTVNRVGPVSVVAIISNR